MQYVLSFLEGIFTFVSPCLLPMLPVYVSYFSGKDNKGNSSALKGALGFVLGFSAVFITLGAFAGTLGSLLVRYERVVDVVGGAIVILFGLGYIGLFRLPSLGFIAGKFKSKGGFFSSVLFGAVFSVGWTPCVGAFLGSALILAAQSGQSLQGVIMLTLYSVGLGVPFILCALLIDRLKTTFDFIKKHYKVINAVSGALLIITGVAMISGYMRVLLTLLSF